MWKKCREIKILLPWTRHNQPGVQDPSSVLSSSPCLSERRSNHLYYAPSWNRRTRVTAGFFWTVLQGLVCHLPRSPQLLGAALLAPAKPRSKGSWRPSTALSRALVLICCSSWAMGLWLCAQCAQSWQETVLFEWHSLNHKWWEEFLPWKCFWRCLPMFLIYTPDTLSPLSTYLLPGMGCYSCKQAG